MNKYIDADALKKELVGWETEPTDEEIEWVIDNAPTADVVEVVRCKDCAWARKVDNREPMFRCVNICRDGCTQWLDSNDFCSYGERREQ